MMMDWFCRRVAQAVKRVEGDLCLPRTGELEHGDLSMFAVHH